MVENWGNLAAIGLGMGLYVLAVEMAWRRVGEPGGWPHEIGRKAHHIGIGLVAVICPDWLVSPWSTPLITLSAGVFLLAGYRFRFLRSLFDPRPPQEGRRALRPWSHTWIGPAAFTLAVLVCHVFFWAERPLYKVSMLVLTFGDAGATIVGLLAGRHAYRLFGARRSLEGHAALLVLAMAICILALPQAGASAVAFALLFALFLCMVEAVSPSGLDNLTLPLASVGGMSLLRTEVAGTLSLTVEGVLMMLWIALSASFFTLAHLRPGTRHMAVLAMGASVILLAETGQGAALLLLGGFVLLAVAASTIERWRMPDHVPPEGRFVLTQLIPCVGFVALGSATGNPTFLIGSLASLTVLSRRCLQQVRPAGEACSPPPAKARGSRARHVLLEGLYGASSAWGALLAGAASMYLFDLQGFEAATLAILLAALAGGFLGTVLQASLGPLQTHEGDSLRHQLAPALLALCVVPLVSALLMSLTG